MELSIIQIGGSRGIRLPKAILGLLGNPNKVELSMQGKKIVLEPKEERLKGWEESAERLHRDGEDRLVYEDTMDSDHPDWNW